MNQIENVIFVVIDALRADRVHNNNSRSHMPNLSSIAENGTEFANTFTCASNTDPSITSILTGRYPKRTVYHHGKLVTDSEKHKIEQVTSLPENLSQAGLHTLAIGQSLKRWHSQGFDRYPGTEESDYQTSIMDMARYTFDLLNSVSPRFGSMCRSIWGLSNRDFVSDTVVQDYNPTTLLSQVESEPFFGFIHLMDTHMPYIGTIGDFDTIVEEYEYPNESLKSYATRQSLTDAQHDRLNDAMSTLNLSNIGELIALYDAAVRRADRKVGNLVNTLKKHNKWENTALFVTSDHGESLLENDIHIDHHGLYDEVFQVPLITNLGPGGRFSQLVQLIDLAPTVYDLLNLKAPQTDGQSLVPLISGQEEEWSERTAVFAEEAYTQRQVAIRTKKWKYIYHTSDEALEDERGSSLRCGYCNTVHGDPPELFNLETDPDERINVIDEHPEVVSRLQAEYESFQSGLAAVEGSGRDMVSYDNEEEILEKLEAIGYK